MKLCPTCKNQYADDANFCPREECAGPGGPQRLVVIVEEAPARFVPLSRLGGGASGEVWQASDAQSGAAVAYKTVVAAALPTPTAIDRAQRELRQLQRANNPHIVKVVDFGKTSEGRLFVAAELASGEPLDQVVARSGPLPLDRAKRIAAQVGEALLEAQKVGVVHRDLAAKNVLVSADDEVRLINFAIPRPFSDTVFGVPEFMSPEQSEGKLIDQRSNTYSLGALLYLMLTGHPPHSGESPQATIEAIQKGEITPPSIKRGSGLTAEVDRILLKAMERNSSRRPLTMRQFLTDVSGLIVTEPTATPGPGSGSAGREAAFARTMMFAGGASEVQKLVAQAVAARQAGGGGAEPAESAAAAAAATDAPSKPARQMTPPPLGGRLPPGTPPPMVPGDGTADARHGVTPPPAHRPSHGAAVAATMIAMPAANGSIPGGGRTSAGPSEGLADDGAGLPAAQPTPPLRGLEGAAAAAGPGGAAPDAANFRETLWFKKGDVDQMVAEARAKVAAAVSANAAKKEAEVAVEDAKPLEDRYVDDGTVTVEDRKKFSLRSGATSTSMPARGGSVPGERMSEDEILQEIGGGRRVVIIGIVVTVSVALLAVIGLSLRGKGKDKGPEAAGAISAPVVPAPAPAAPPPPAAPAAVAPAAAPVAPKAAADAVVAERKAEAPAPRPAAAKKRAVARKKAAVAKKRK